MKNDRRNEPRAEYPAGVLNTADRKEQHELWRQRERADHRHKKLRLGYRLNQGMGTREGPHPLPKSERRFETEGNAS